MQSSELTQLDPRDAAVALATSSDAAWMGEFASALREYRAEASPRWIFDAWGLSQSEAGRLFGVSRQAIGQWLSSGVPTAHTVAFADLAAATEVLQHYVRAERIPAVVRRPAPALGHKSLVDLIADGRTSEVLAACRAMFQFAGAHR